MAKLYFRYASMNAGKSTYLLQVAHNYKENNKETLLLTADVDDRAGVGVIASRLGLSHQAQTFSKDLNFLEYLKDCEAACVLIDEAQFLTSSQAKQLHQWVHLRNKPVMCFGLRTDFRGLPFEGASMLLALADDIDEIVTICACGKRATMQVRVDEEGNRILQGPQLEIGGNSRYRHVCARCFYYAD